MDPTFEFHATLGRLLGVILMRLSGEAILPFDYNPYASLLQYRDPKRPLQHQPTPRFN